MDKLNMQSKDILSENLQFIASRFPNVITESKDENGNLTRKIDFELLMQELSGEIVEGNKERYQLTWPGKKEAILNANTPINKTLRPVIEDSVDFENTENLYIEGDNLEVLKLLQESYLGKIKCIYIDPPYNTGRDFIYNDKYKANINEYLDESGQIDDEGNMLFQNTESNGRFHSDWMTMIYPRLKLARNLLSDNGVIFISIDENEESNLSKICDEIFGANNLISKIPWQARQSIQNDTDLSSSHEYILAYAKTRRQEHRRLKETNSNQWHKLPSFACYPLPLDNSKFSNPDNDPRGAWKADPFDAPNVRPNLTYPIVNPNTGESFMPPNGRCWRTEEKSYQKLFEDNRIIFGKSGQSKPQLKVFYNEKKEFGSVENTWFDGTKCGTATAGTKELQELFDGVSYFDTPKPTKLIKKLLQLSTRSGDLVLDFFSGSSTTAHAVMDMNAEDGGNRKYIMVQVNEDIPENHKAYEKGYRSIPQIAKDRIKRAGQKIKQETNADIDYGFRVYKVDSTNMKDTYYNIEQITQTSLFETQSNIKEDRTPEDLLTQVILDLGLELSLKIEEKNINGKKVFYVDEDSLVACFDEGVDKDLATIIAKDMPMKVVFRDSCFINDSEKENIKEIFKKYSPDTDIKVL